MIIRGKKVEDLDYRAFQFMDLTPQNVDDLFNYLRYDFELKRFIKKEDHLGDEMNIFENNENPNYPPVYVSCGLLIDNSHTFDIVKYLFGQLQAIHEGDPAAAIDTLRAKFMKGPNGIIWADDAHTKELYELMYLGVGTGLIAPLKEVNLEGTDIVAVDLTHAKAKEIIPCVSKETRARYSVFFDPENH